MLKTILIMSLFCFPLLGFSQACKVFGISDSPQALSCDFPQISVKLSCLKGRYYLNQSLVKLAFHMEVEEGTVPLVFKAQDMQLTVLMDRPITAELEMPKVNTLGVCR